MYRNKRVIDYTAYPGETIGEYIRRVREQHRYSREALAMATGISKATLFNYEKGLRKHRVSLGIIAALAKELGMDLNVLGKLLLEEER